jgi:hypothetical protein
LFVSEHALFFLCRAPVLLLTVPAVFYKNAGSQPPDLRLPGLTLLYVVRHQACSRACCRHFHRINLIALQNAIATPLCGALGQQGVILRRSIPLGIAASLLIGLTLFEYIVVNGEYGQHIEANPAH